MILSAAPTADQQAAIDEAKRTRRPVLVIRGHRADFGQSDEVVIECDEGERPGSLIYDKISMRGYRL